jgi:hypothetical protein
VIVPIIAYVDSALLAMGDCVTSVPSSVRFGIYLFIYIYQESKTAFFSRHAWQEITNRRAPPADGKFENHLAYGTFSKSFGRMLEDALPNQGVASRIGLHMFRKTGYKFAIWGGGLWEAIKNDARHVHDSDAKLYAGDSWSSQHLAHIFKDPENAVNNYMPSFIQNHNICAIDNVKSTAAGVSLSKLTQEFITALSISPVVVADQRSLLEFAMTQTHRKPVTKLVEELSSLLNAEQKLLLNNIVSQQGAEERGRSNLVANFAPLEVSTPTFPTFPPLATEAAAPTGSVDLDGRELVAEFTSLEDKVAKIKELGVDLPPLKELTRSAKTFVMRTLQPVLRCLNNHFEGDIAAFSNHWRSGFKSHFSTKCCKGKKGTTSCSSP